MIDIIPFNMKRSGKANLYRQKIDSWWPRAKGRNGRGGSYYGNENVLKVIYGDCCTTQ